MRKYLLLFSIIFFVLAVHAQKKPLDHSVYDGWQSIGERMISNDGKFVVYTINPQEGDGILYIQQTDGKKLIEINRGYNAKISEDNRFVILKIKSAYQQTRTARIQKKKPDEMPKDSLAIVDMNTLHVEKIARIKSYKLPEKSSMWLAYLLEKPLADANRQRGEQDSLSRVNAIAKMADSLSKVADSLRNKIAEVQTKGLSVLLPKRDNKTAPKPNEENVEEGTDLVLINLSTNAKQTFHLVNDYAFSKTANQLVIKTTKKNGDATVKATVTLLDLEKNNSHIVLNGLNEAKGFAFDEEGKQLAFVAERDSAKKESLKFYKLYYYKTGLDSAQLLADKFTKGIADKWSVSEFSTIAFSKSGKRLFFATAPVISLKDTSLPEFERVSVDIWNYKDEDLMTAQLYNLERDLKRNYLARYDFDNKEVVQLSNEKTGRVLQTSEGDGDIFYSSSDFGKRIERQWQGYSLNDINTVDPMTGSVNNIKKDFKGEVYASSTGKYLLMYSEKEKKYAVYNSRTKQTYTIGNDIPFALYEEDNDVPDDPKPHGIVKWVQDDKYVLIYDKYDVWKVDPEAKEKSITITNGRKDRLEHRYVNIDNEEKFIKPDQKLYFRIFSESDKSAGIETTDLAKASSQIIFKEKVSIGSVFAKAKNSETILLSKETYEHSPNLFTRSLITNNEVKLSSTNPQQSNYNWGTAELFKWKAYTGKETEGILYKPENFDAKKKYPMIVYYYERNNNTLYSYQPPAPTPSRLNISFFVSRGYVVFVPDIWYTSGHPGKNAYDYIVSGTKALIKQGYIDSTKLGLQGQSWGGYQTAILITQTNLFAAAWAGAPVVDMFSAYGGIRWESGVNRQMQYEHGQSRIGSTPWDRRDLYIENSPFFHLQNIKTPLVIMSNDNDGAVPWYQGIEFFTAMRRLHKPVWLLNYNGEQHNLVERKNRKDISIREQQYFDWLLKGEKPAKWITDGVPATMKGRDWGLKIE
jgi:dipeptidyl aminopeptidase/acylaminoacyl peptidase